MIGGDSTTTQKTAPDDHNAAAEDLFVIYPSAPVPKTLENASKPTKLTKSIFHHIPFSETEFNSSCDYYSPANVMPLW